MPVLFARPLEPVRQLRALVSLVRQLGDEQRERLGVAGDPQGAGVHGLEAHVADQPGGHLFAALVVAAVYEARAGARSPGLVDAEEHLARHGVEGGDDPRSWNLLRELLRARGRVAEDEPGVVGVHRQRAGHDHLSRQVAGLLQHVVDSRPVHGQQEGVRAPARPPSACPPARSRRRRARASPASPGGARS